MRTDFSEVKSVFGFRVRLQNPKSRSQNLNPDFPIERNLLNACTLVPTVFRWHKQMNSNFILFFVFLRPCKMKFHFHFYFSFFVDLWHWKTDLNFVFRFSFSPHFEKGIWISVFVFRFLITLKNGFEFRFSCFVFASVWKTDFNFVFRICIACYHPLTLTEKQIGVFCMNLKSGLVHQPFETPPTPPLKGMTGVMRGLSPHNHPIFIPR